MEDLGKHPFNYQLEDIKDYIIDLVNIGESEHALNSIKYIKRQYVTGKNSGEINYSRMPFYHLEEYHISDFAHVLNGSKYPDGSSYRLIYELNQLLEWVQSKQVQKNPGKPKDGKTSEFYALFHFYQRETIGLTEENKTAFGEKYGFANGKRLFLDFQRLSDNHNRLEEPKSKTKLKNRIALLKRVQEHLPDELKNGRIATEIQTLEVRFSSEYN